MKKLLYLLVFGFFIFTSPSYCDDIEDAAVFYNEAIDLYQQNEIEKSIELFKKATDLNPEFREAHYNLSQILMSQDKNEEALYYLKELLKLNSDDSETLYNIGKIQYKRGYLSNAKTYLKQVHETAPQYESAKLIITKIEKRQEELNLEAKLSKKDKETDKEGNPLNVDLVEIQAPSGIAVDSKGNIYTASFLENVIYKISNSGKKIVFSRSGLIKGPVGLTVDKADNIYVSNYSANTIVKITSDGTSSIFAKIQKPYCLIYDDLHDRIYVTEQNSNKLVKYDL